MRQVAGLFWLFFLSVACVDMTWALASECPLASTSRQPAIIGLALDTKTQDPLYCEYYYPQGKNTLVEYRTLDNTLIVRKRLIYSDNPLQPEVVQEDLRHGELRKVVVESESADNIKVYYLEPHGSEALEASVNTSANLVVDAGFDEAVRQHWDGLLKGEAVSMDFLSPVHLKAFNLSIELAKPEECLIPQQTQYFVAANQELLSTACFIIRPTHALLKLFAEPLMLLYDKSNQRLLSYRGNVNVTSEYGSTLKATIYYSYQDKDNP